jgi:hypothetical protein
MGVDTKSGFGSWRHLSTRFLTSLSPKGPESADEAWALEQLLSGEQVLWRRMSGPDRRHAIGVARDALSLVGPEQASREVAAAALLHDVGKVESSIGTLGRVAVTFAALTVGRTRLLAWASRGPGERPTSPRSRVALYLTHDRVGARLLEEAGSDGLVVSWSAEHHTPAESWTVDPAIGAALKAADGD